jgi:hypothetical protein
MIDLGDAGTLIAPIQVEGHWYYYWDRSGDGTSANIGGLNGGNDNVTHDVLDGIFNNDSSGVTNTTVTNVDGKFGTTDTFRFATINGVDLALPTHGGSLSGVNAVAGSHPGTDIQTNTIADNPTYDDLLAVWDSSNGASTGTNIGGTPSGWLADVYWSATPSVSGHARVNLNSGYAYDNPDYSSFVVALAVL